MVGVIGGFIVEDEVVGGGGGGEVEIEEIRRGD